MPCLATEFGQAMDRLGPFEPYPALAVAVSGGADSMALAILAHDWARRYLGSVRALVVDHGLRSASADEARITVERLSRLGITAKLLCIADLKHGPALAERARIRRYEVLTMACREAGILHLLLGHHVADQIETLAMRVLRDSQAHGLAGMSALIETPGLRLLRPLLAVEPARLRSLLTAKGIEWVEDPSNQDTRALRSRLRLRLQPRQELRQAMASVAALRSREESEAAAELAQRATIRPEGFALLTPGRIRPAALGALIRTISGASYPSAAEAILRLATEPGPATVAGVRILPAGRYGRGWLIVREEAAVMAPMAAPLNTAYFDMIWDNRFRLTARHALPNGATIGKLGDDAARFRGVSDLPSVVLRTLPAVRIGNFLAAVPHLVYACCSDDAKMTVLFSPPHPASGPGFVAAL